MLFHYHFWTPYVEETEAFYRKNSFRVAQRIGRYENQYQSFNPPQTWNDFRDKDIAFTIIEMKKGAINITFGFGKKIKFDHIGFLVSNQEHQMIIENARQMHLNVQTNERRSFISTLYGFRIELQTHQDAVESADSPVKIRNVKMSTLALDFKDFLSHLFHRDMHEIIPVHGDKVTIKSTVFEHMNRKSEIDPNGVKLLFDNE
jgi:hypothetical protein